MRERDDRTQHLLSPKAGREKREREKKKGRSYKRTSFLPRERGKEEDLNTAFDQKGIGGKKKGTLCSAFLRSSLRKGEKRGRCPKTYLRGKRG